MANRSKQRKTRARVKKERVEFNSRPFAGLATETEWVALRELVPSATAAVRLADSYQERDVTIATVLPMAYPALVKGDGRILLGVQASSASGDLSRDLAAVLHAALHAEPGSYVELKGAPEPGPRLQDLLADGGALDATLHETFGFWLDDETPEDPKVAESFERANASILPTTRMSSAVSAYWCHAGDKAHMRWVLPDEEETALAALARLHSAGELSFGDETRYAGAFRAHGLLVPVWDLPSSAAADDWEEPLGVLSKAYQTAIADTTELTTSERQSRSVLQARQLTLR